MTRPPDSPTDSPLRAVLTETLEGLRWLAAGDASPPDSLAMVMFLETCRHRLDAGETLSADETAVVDKARTAVAAMLAVERERIKKTMH